MKDNDRNGRLLEAIAQGDQGAMDELVSSNMGLVKSIALRFRDRGAEYEDLVQIGTIGMIKAARSFDFSYNTVFSTYAVPLIVGEIRRFLRDDGPVKVSRRIKAQAMEIMRAKEEFIKREGREPRLSELSAECGVGVEDLVFALEATGPIRSLNETLGNDDDAILADILPANDGAIETLTDVIALREAIGRLTEDQKKIVDLRYFRDLSQQQTGEVLGLSQVKISREEKKIIKLLRDAL